MADQYLTLAVETALHNPKVWQMRPHQRSGHLLVLGVDGPARQGLFLEAMAQDIAAGAGVAVLDTTGRYARAVLDLVPPERLNHTYLFQPHATHRVIGYNPFAEVPAADRATAAQDIMEVFKLIWGLDYTSHPLLLDLLRFAARVLLDTEAGTMVSLYGLLTNDTERQRLVRQCNDAMARKFWRDFDTWSPQDKRDKPQSVLTRLRAFLSDPRLRGMLGQPRGKLSFPTLVGRHNVFVADLARGELGAETSQLLAVSFAFELERVLRTRRDRWPFYAYLPDVQFLHPGVGARTLATDIPGAGWTVGIDQIAGLAPQLRAGLLGAERVLAFRVGPDDARQVAGRFRLPQAETTLTQLAEDRVAISGTKYEWRPIEPLRPRYGQAAHITRRSAQALGVPPQAVQRKIDQYLDGL